MRVSFDVRKSTNELRTFVHHVPPGAAALVSASQRLDVVVHDLNQGLVVETTIDNPIGKLTVPDQVVAVDLVSVVGGEINIAIRVFEREVALCGLSGLPTITVSVK